MPELSQRQYVDRVLALYRLMPGVRSPVRRADRSFAAALFDRAVPLGLVSAALMLAVARRTFRSGEPLPPISSLHYIKPILEELLASPPPSDYIDYLAFKLRPIAPLFTAAASDHHLS